MARLEGDGQGSIEKSLDDRPLIRDASVLEVAGSAKNPTRTSSMTNKEVIIFFVYAYKF